MFNTMNIEPGGGCNDSSWFLWIIVILALFNGGNWGNNASAVKDQYTLASDFATLQRQIDSTTADIKTQNVAIGNGISSLGYDQLSRMNGIDSNIASSTNALLMNANQAQNAIVSGITNLGSQMQSCCCDQKYQSATQSAELNYRLAEQSCQTRQAIADSTAAIISNHDAGIRSILEVLNAQTIAAKDDKIADLTAKVNALNLAASQQAQNAYLISQLAPSNRCSCGC